MLKPGMILCDRYEILEVVGAGGMSIVYKARDHRLNRNVAIKMLKPEFVNDKNFVTKFRIEAQASAGLAHPNIVNVYDVTEDDGIYFIVMELVEGITLKEYIDQNGRLPMDKAIDFSIQIASALEIAHENHIIHRDIKPQNILVSKNGNLKVTDFGIAKAASSNTLTSGAMGSVHYISPEQARGGYSDERSDIYSLGITMYEMVTGRVPFEGDNNVSVALMHIQNDMISPREYYPDIYASFEKIILKATQKKPERRYLTASALIADLRRVQNNPNIDIVVAPTGISNRPTQEWSKEDIDAVRSASQAKPVGNGQPQFYNAPIQNEMGEMQPIQRLSTIPVNNQRINQLFEEEDPWEDEEEEEVAPPPRKSSLKRVQDYDEEDDYDEDDGDIDPNLKKAVIIGAVATAVIIAIIVMVVLGKVLGWFKFGNKQTTESTTSSESEISTEELAVMDDVVGISEDAALKILRDNSGFTNVTSEHVNNTEVQEGYVFEQSVEKGTPISKDAPIVIKVSAGAEEKTIPDVTNYEDDQAVTILQEAGFTVTHAYEFNDEIEKDKVVRTEPAGNSMAKEGTKITLVISNGKEEKNVEVPNLNGYTQAEAENALAAKQLSVGNVTHENSDNVAEGYVIRQGTQSGSEVPEGTAIDFVISDGPEEKTVTYTADVKVDISANDTGSVDDEGNAIPSKYVGHTVTIRVSNGTVTQEQTVTINTEGKASANVSIDGLATNNESFTYTVYDGGNDVTGDFAKTPSTTYREN
ncbi:MAG: Stk1 family PASTA domain-containing Ser/Thr kinase [Lachnospiraceae bacterium]|nr:Stk1 family PASTA domain-containing Ser/Thr kinase [Lachnospiraceae bacterium]